ncbi:MAG TPA: hypothetical protein VKU01_12055 [Bryobacteraceae bacterium]|nr:hypothetical protein [Bryobacteraceae bacterium]
MNCAEWEEKIALYLGDDLAVHDLDRVEGHLRACAECARFYKELKLDANSLRSAPPEAATADYSVLRRLIRRRVASEQWRKRLVPLIAVAAAVVLAIVVRSTAPQPVIPAPQPIVVRMPAPRVEKSVHTGGAGLQPARFHPKHPTTDPDLEAALMRFTNSELPQQEAHPKTPIEMRVRTKDPNVTIVVFQPNEATPNENE